MRKLQPISAMRRWRKTLAYSAFMRHPLMVRAHEYWSGTHRHCFIEVGRGELTCTVWQWTTSNWSRVKICHRSFDETDEMVSAVTSLIRELEFNNLIATIIVYSPWAVVKTFKLNVRESPDVHAWILHNRDRVFAQGIEEDTTLSYCVFNTSDSYRRLIVGLARRSIVERLRSACERAGIPIARVLHGPLASIESLNTNSETPCQILYKQRLSSASGWLIDGSTPIAWTEVMSPVDNDHVESDALVKLRQSLEQLTGHHVEVQSAVLWTADALRCFLPMEVNLVKRFRRYMKVTGVAEIGRRSISAALHLAASCIVPLVVRWSTIMTIIVVVIGLLTRAAVPSGKNSIQQSASDLSSRRDILIREQGILFNRLQRELARRESVRLTAALWRDIGTSMPTYTWLSSLELPPTVAGERTWSLSGLTTVRAEPNQLVAILNLKSLWNAQLLRLEKVDRQFVSRRSIASRIETYRFLITVGR